jgi:hypothetical protein
MSLKEDFFWFASALCLRADHSFANWSREPAVAVAVTFIVSVGTAL